MTEKRKGIKAKIKGLRKELRQIDRELQRLNDKKLKRILFLSQLQKEYNS